MLERRDAAALVLPHFFDTNMPQTGNLNPIVIAPVTVPSPLNPGPVTAIQTAPAPAPQPPPDGDGDADDPIPAPEPPPPPGFPDNIPDTPISGPIGPG